MKKKLVLCTQLPEKRMEETLAGSPDPEKWLFKMEQLLKEQAPENSDNYSAAAIFTIGEE